MTKDLALFDFDGTLTSKDTLFEFLKYHHGPTRYWVNLALLLPVFVLYGFRIIPNWKAKEMVLQRFLNGVSQESFQTKCQEFSNFIIPKLLRPDALQKLNEHKANYDRVIVISASAQNWIQGWCDALEIEIIATKLVNQNGTLTGKIDGQNCHGLEKVNRLRSYLNLQEYQTIYAYGDSRGDRELLEIATNPHYRLFKKSPAA